jgi:hypothetical protein
MTNSADSRVYAPRCHICVIALSTAQMHFQVILARESALRREGIDTGGVPNDPITETRRS